MNRLDIEAHVAPMQDGFGVRLKLRGASCPAVWAGQGWDGVEAVPKGAHTTDGNIGWLFDLREDAVTYLDTLRAEQQMDGRA